MDQLIELFNQLGQLGGQIQEMSQAGADALQQTGGGGAPEGGAPPEAPPGPPEGA